MEQKKKPLLRIGEILAEKGISNSQFAQMLGVTPQYTSTIVHERGQVSIKKLAKIADMLDVNIKELFR